MRKIKTVIISIQNREAQSRAAQVLDEGELVAFPTDTVYGLGARAFDRAAVEKIYLAKNRPTKKAIPVLIGTPEDLKRVSTDIPTMAWSLAARFWPGPLTLVVPKHPRLPDAISASNSVGVRMPDHRDLLRLISATGSLAATSANISGLAAPKTIEEVIRQMNGRIRLILDGGTTPGGIPSTVVNCLGPDPVILRAGPVSMKDIQNALS